MTTSAWSSISGDSGALCTDGARFTMGQISTAYAKNGMAVGPALRLGVAWGYLMMIVAAILIIAACITIRRDYKSSPKAAGH